jgi:ATP adenylyltransferase
LERNNLWAPWRLQYIQGLNQTTECFICHNLNNPQDDDKACVLWRTKNCIVILNHFPYNNGHLLICPNRHIDSLDKANEEELLEMMKVTREAEKALRLVLKPNGFNIGINLGRCAGAGLPGHLHIHIVPRWEGDTNFMTVCGDTKVISQDLGDLLHKLKNISKEHNLPAI